MKQKDHGNEDIERLEAGRRRTHELMARCEVLVAMRLPETHSGDLEVAGQNVIASRFRLDSAGELQRLWGRGVGAPESNCWGNCGVFLAGKRDGGTGAPERVGPER
jgi:hypothetical protein